MTLEPIEQPAASLAEIARMANLPPGRALRLLRVRAVMPDTILPCGRGVRMFAGHRVAEIVEMLRASSGRQ